mmetsp:Transcript_37725/g.94609  ORF Transcript_37725/g.94609 Transcript_37725/m.94609 type:complete len:205 (+) Transcript_37725:616-1230(+)
MRASRSLSFVLDCISLVRPPPLCRVSSSRPCPRGILFSYDFGSCTSSSPVSRQLVRIWSTSSDGLSGHIPSASPGMYCISLPSLTEMCMTLLSPFGSVAHRSLFSSTSAKNGCMRECREFSSPLHVSRRSTTSSCVAASSPNMASSSSTSDASNTRFSWIFSKLSIASSAHLMILHQSSWSMSARDASRVAPSLSSLSSMSFPH